MVAVEDHWYYLLELTDEGFKFAHKLDSPQYRNAVERIEQGPLDLAGLDDLVETVGFFTAPKLLLEAWRAKVIDQKTLAHALIPLVPAAISPDQALTKQEWAEIFTATGFVSNFGFPAEQLNVYRCCAPEWRKNLCWSTHPAVALGVAEANNHRDAVLYKASVPASAIWMRFCGSELMLNTDRIFIHQVHPSIVRRARHGDSGMQTSIIKRAEKQQQIWSQLDPSPEEADEALWYDYRLDHQDKRDQIDLCGWDTLTYLRAFRDRQGYIKLRDSLRTDVLYGS